MGSGCEQVYSPRSSTTKDPYLTTVVWPLTNFDEKENQQIYLKST